MGAGNANRVFEARDLGQHVGPAHHGNARCPRRQHFRIVLPDRRGNDHRARALHVLAAMADEDIGPLLPQALHIGAVGYVRALDLVAHGQHHIGNARHADAANADDMCGAEIERRG